MNTYRVRIQPGYSNFMYPWGVQPLEVQALSQALLGATIRELRNEGTGVVALDVDMQRPDHLQAMNEILAVVEQSGYAVLNGYVTEWASQSVEGAIIGLLGGGLLGTKTESGLGMLIAVTAGAISGSLVGSTMKKAEKVLQFQPTYWGGWSVNEVPLENAGPITGRTVTN